MLVRIDTVRTGTRSPLTLSYRRGTVTTQPGQGAWSTKPLRSYVILGAFRQVEISEGRFKRLLKQHRARTGRKAIPMQGYCFLSL
ncbi:hypothetical protein BN8_03690 [Fibrisoma limi BUZ 3]|uniref:Uncharacterized protein n=1 Tax=Fibrisoma limi BUZ 3 TaxID=1185876 RepID=I2GKT6_9BACT|nr:hypothetical protein [Fibrisoma limi]CCH54512.1 hypothetical protein BN8_03690 [Fibrisoma limi BUZ 3]